MSYSGWIGVDLDGALAKYNSGDGVGDIGEPVILMLETVARWLRNGVTVKIFTARVAYDPDGSQEKIIQDWTERYLGERLEVTCKKDYAMIELWDDRRVQVIPNSGTRVDGKDN